ncbi:acyl-CoA synthetase [Aquabacterium sp. CECT 9606]|uniref:acyl-CoA synthetase n=1 Tax=Aquabacterium sp. CECT 9606 TaxID=2845822 RepID=UPI001E30D305|nr:acyl-CoA synthetase [Aquabacterium sp. CECT 9606]
MNALAASPIRSLQDIEAMEASLPDLMAGQESTYALLSQGAKVRPNAAALSFFLRTDDHHRPYVWTHREWLTKITQAANMFRQLGVQRDDVVAFVLPNLPETHWTIWGGEAAGIVFAINPLLEPSMMLDLLKAAQPKWIVTLAPTPGADLWEKVAGIAPQVPGLKGVLSISPLRYLRHPLAPLLRLGNRLKTPRRLGTVPVLNFHQALERQDGSALGFAPPGLDDVASYFCTGGTTGMPKIAVRTHRTEVANALELAAVGASELDGPDVTVFCGLPLFHVNAQIGTGLSLWARGGHVLLGTPQGYRGDNVVKRFWELVAHHKLVSFSGVPTVYAALLQVPRKGHDLSSLRFGVCGAAPMPVEMFNRVQNELGLKVLEGYGLTEAGCVSSLTPLHAPPRIGSIGLRMPWQDMRVALIGADGEYLRDAEVDEVGTIIIKGPNLFKGYLNPAHNKGLWVTRPGLQGQPERWLNTGDLGRADGDGYFWLTGRQKELIIRGGHNIDPKMIEEPMCTHPSVAMAAAVGRPDAHAGEVPVVYVQLRPGCQAKEDELMDHARSTIAERAAHPKIIRIVDILPTTAIGKIFKPTLIQSEVQSVFMEEAAKLGVREAKGEACQDVKLGLVLRWQASGDVAALKASLDRYTFRHEQA